jgi:hypothetical protein
MNGILYRGVWGSLFKPTTIYPVLVGRPFDTPFDKLTVLSKVEGLRALSKIEGHQSPTIKSLLGFYKVPPEWVREA